MYGGHNEYKTEKIVELLKLNTYEVQSLAKMFEVSEKTILNDIDTLQSFNNVNIVRERRFVYIPINYLNDTNSNEDLYLYKLQIYYLLGLKPSEISPKVNYSNQKIYADLRKISSSIKLKTEYQILNPIIYLKSEECEKIAKSVGVNVENQYPQIALIAKIYNYNRDLLFSNIDYTVLIKPFEELIVNIYDDYEIVAYELSSEFINNIEKIHPVEMTYVQKFNLFQHVKRIYISLKYNICQDNSNLSYVYQKYKHELNTVCVIIRATLAAKSLYIVENEVLFIAIHFLMDLSQKSVILICSSGYTSTFLLKNKLEQYFTGFKIKAVIPKEELEAVKAIDDIVISTIPLEFKNAIIVSPNFKKADIEKLSKILTLNKQPMDESLRLYKQYKPLFKREVTYDNFLKYYKQSEGRPMLKELLTINNIQIIDENIDWKEAIRIASIPLIKDKKIEDRYVEAMINSLVKNGPYVCFTNLFAMPHARPEDGVRETCMSMLICTQPVDLLGNQTHVFVVLGSSDNDSHILALTQLTDYISDQQFIIDLINCKNVNDVIERINL